MLSEVNMLHHSNDVVLVRGILVHEELEQLALLLSKLMVNLRVPVDLYSDSAAAQMIYRRYYLCEASLTEYFYNFEAVQYLVLWLQNVIPFLIVLICYGSRLTNPSRNVICVINHAIGQVQFLQLLDLLLGQNSLVESCESFALHWQRAIVQLSWCQNSSCHIRWFNKALVRSRGYKRVSVLLSHIFSDDF